MHSARQAPAVQGRGARAAALAEALASLGRTRARMASLTAYGNGRWRAPGQLGRAGAGGAREPSGPPGKLRDSAPGSGWKEPAAGCAGPGLEPMLCRLGGCLEPVRGCLQKESVE